ncbi:MAG: hypothetical protein CO129_09595 [Ignavibacteriales bacterium CG_4_9_14_3_um_filter_34_10]|nr:MAG: hypothetical protein CO129_09595 [Ignavibacteriales bacterium CG_4_9_14_3_um_filter_34_10]
MHISQIKYFIPAVFILIFEMCSNENEQQKKRNFVAKVNNTVLTKEALKSIAEKHQFSKKFGDEIISEWVEKELLYNEAKDEGVTYSDEYKQMINQSKKELATALYLQKYFENNLKAVTESEIQNYFIQNMKDYRLKDEAFYLNLIKFKNINAAEAFRDIAVGSSWIQAVNQYSNDPSKIDFIRDEFLYKYQVQPLKFLRAIEGLKSDEISIVIQTAEDEFMVAQIAAKFGKDSIPDFEFVKSDVEKRYYAKTKKDLYKKLINELSEKYKVEINGENIK